MSGRAHQHVIAGAAVHPLGAIDDDQVVEGVTQRIVEVPVDDQVFDVVRQGDGGPTDLRVDATPGRLLDSVVGIVDPKPVVAGRPDQQVAPAVAGDRGIAFGGMDGLVARGRAVDVRRLGRRLRHRVSEIIEVGHGSSVSQSVTGWRVCHRDRASPEGAIPETQTLTRHSQNQST